MIQSKRSIMLKKLGMPIGVARQIGHSSWRYTRLSELGEFSELDELIRLNALDGSSELIKIFRSSNLVSERVKL